MTTHQLAQKTPRAAALIKVLCAAWLCASLAAGPDVADAATGTGPAAAAAAMLRHATPRLGCGARQQGMGEAGGKAEALGLRDRTASPVTTPIGDRTCRLIAAAEVSIRNNPGIF